jgi:hypothetical protein
MGLPINLPRRLVKNKSAFTAEWGNSIREAISRLSKRQPPIMPAPGGGEVHPWKVTANGDDKVAIAAGELLSFDHEALTTTGDIEPFTRSTYFTLKDFASYAGGDVEVTGSGVVYAKVTASAAGVSSTSNYEDDFGTDHKVSLFTVEPFTAAEPLSEITIHYESEMPTSGDAFYVKLAEVSLDDSIAVVDKQIITHNPTLWIPTIRGELGGEAI